MRANEDFCLSDDRILQFGATPMRFSLKETIQSLHRRTRSDGFVLLPHGQASSSLSSDILVQSASFPVVDSVAGEVNVFCSFQDVSGSISSRPTFLSDVTIPELRMIKQRIRRLQADNRILTEKVATLELEASLREQHCTYVRGELLREKLQTFSYECTIRDQASQIEEQSRQITQLQQFVSAMNELKLSVQPPVLEVAKDAVFRGDSADEALIEAIKSAASNPESCWFRLMPAITGPRTPENYLSAINMTLKARKELKEAHRVVRFWKKRALLDPSNADVLTPSPSNLSDYVEELSEERKRAVDELIKRRQICALIPPVVENYAHEANIGPNVDSASVIEIDTNTVRGSANDSGIRPSAIEVVQRDHPIVDIAPVEVVHGGESHPVSPKEESNSPSEVSLSSTVSSALPPLASELFREERIATHPKSSSIGNRSSSGSGLSNRSVRQTKKCLVLGTIDINRDTKKTSKSSSSITKGVRRPATPSLRKKKKKTRPTVRNITSTTAGENKMAVCTLSVARCHFRTDIDNTLVTEQTLEIGT